MEFNQQHLLLLLFLCISIQFPVLHCCHDEERIALLSFKSLLSDPSGRLATWQSINCCNWRGVHCSTDSLHVVSIDLRNPYPDVLMRNIYGEVVSTAYTSSALNGTLSPSLFNLTHLEYLDLSYNNFHFSKLPQQFANLKNLTHLDLSNSVFSGSITKQFANLSLLNYLDISVSSEIIDFSSFSYNFSTMKGSTNFITTYYSSSYISSTDISWLRGLVNLKMLDLSGVDLGLTTSTMNWAQPISFLTNLEELHLSDCNISSPLPIKEFLNLSRLSYLQMDSNFLDSPIPNQLANLTYLSKLALRNCHLQGSIPYLPQLQQLWVSVNPDLLVNLTWMLGNPWNNLKQLWITSIKVIGSIPSSISNASSLVSLEASGCSIQGSIPPSFSNLSKLEYADLSFNNITGYLPSSIFKLQNLQTVSFYQNNLQGSIPESICKIYSLQRIVLGSNNLSGTIPSCITKLPNLYVIDVTTNSIEGNFSLTPFINESNLTWINFDSNKITVEIDQNLLLSSFKLLALALKSCNLKGYIPPFICKMKMLFVLDLANNNLRGSIPSCLFELPNLSYLDLSRNNFHGTVPHSLYLSFLFPIPMINLASNNLGGPLPLPPQNVGVFDLSNNKFTGQISNEIGERLSNAGFVSLSGNELVGSIPFFNCSGARALKHLDLSNNKLSGTIPSLRYCNSLVSLNLGRNNLIGNLPNELGQARKLKNLQLNDNNLSGAFPNFIQQLKKLEVLNLGSNKFEGNIPTFICTLSNLKILSLRSNTFNGSIPKDIIHLLKVQILDLSINNLSGMIPKQLGNFEMLKSRPRTKVLLGDEASLMYSGVQMELVFKGIMQHFEFLYNFNSGIDLSCNSLEGNIPEEISSLKGLSMLNLSHNHLSGKIPMTIGNMTGLESLDLGFNKLSGSIPQSLTFIDSLGTLDLSYNNLSGMVPRGYHFDTISADGSAYIGNSLLCGFPTEKSCDQDDSTSSTDTLQVEDEDEDEEDAVEKWLFYGLIVLGYGVGLWGLFLVLLIRKEKWWYGYWRAIDNVALTFAGCILRKDKQSLEDTQ